MDNGCYKKEWENDYTYAKKCAKLKWCRKCGRKYQENFVDNLDCCKETLGPLIRNQTISIDEKIKKVRYCKMGWAFNFGK